MKKFITLLCITLSSSVLFISCGGNENDDDLTGEAGVTNIIISPNSYNIVLDEEANEQQSFTFTVSSNTGQEITDFCFFYLDGEEISSNSFTPEQLGSHQVSARYEALESNTITINVVDVASTYYNHKVLVEDFTGTWCGWCTRIIYALELIEAQTHNVVPVAIHNNDEFEFSGRMPLENYLQVNGMYPFATINRKTVWTPQQHENINQPLSLIQPTSPIGIKINSNLGATSGSVDLSFAFKEDIPGDLQYAVYIVENGLIADQKNYNETLYGGVMPTLPNFTHNHTLRGVYGDIIGNSLGQQALEEGEITLSGLNVNYTSENVNNLQVVAFIMDAQGNVLNTQIADGNTEKDYEFAH